MYCGDIYLQFTGRFLDSSLSLLSRSMAEAADMARGGRKGERGGRRAYLTEEERRLKRQRAPECAPGEIAGGVPRRATNVELDKDWAERNRGVTNLLPRQQKSFARHWREMLDHQTWSGRTRTYVFVPVTVQRHFSRLVERMGNRIRELETQLLVREGQASTTVQQSKGSKYRGVAKNGSNGWSSTCYHKGDRKYLGTFPTKEEAARQVDLYLIDWAGAECLPKLNLPSDPQVCRKLEEKGYDYSTAASGGASAYRGVLRMRARETKAGDGSSGSGTHLSWQAVYRYKGDAISCGTYATELEAAMAYNEVAAMMGTTQNDHVKWTDIQKLRIERQLECAQTIKEKNKELRLRVEQAVRQKFEKREAKLTADIERLKDEIHRMRGAKSHSHNKTGSPRAVAQKSNKKRSLGVLGDSNVSGAGASRSSPSMVSPPNSASASVAENASEEEIQIAKKRRTMPMPIDT